jgi:hypothetical protein
MCKKYYGNKYNYYIYTYYISNLNLLGEYKTTIYANKYINNITLGCKYFDQKEIDALVPVLGDIPTGFLDLIKDAF